MTEIIGVVVAVVLSVVFVLAIGSAVYSSMEHRYWVWRNNIYNDGFEQGVKWIQRKADRNKDGGAK